MTHSYLFYSPELRAREAFLTDLNQVINVIEELMSNIKEGAQFYNDLQSRGQQLFQTVSDYSLTRGVEKKDLMMSMHEGDGSYQGGGNGGGYNTNAGGGGAAAIPAYNNYSSPLYGDSNFASSGGPPAYGSVNNVLKAKPVLPDRIDSATVPPPYAAINPRGPHPPSNAPRR